MPLGLLKIGLILGVLGVVGLVALDAFARRRDFVIWGLFLAQGVVFALAGLSGAFQVSEELTAPEIWLGRLSTLIFVVTVALALLRPHPQRAGRLLWLAGVVHFGGIALATLLIQGTVSQGDILALLGLTAVWAAPRVELRMVTLWAKWCLVIILVASAVVALMNAPGAWAPYNASYLPGIDKRLLGILHHANALGPVSVLYLLLEHWQPSPPWVRRILFPLSIVILLLTQSKTAWVGALVVAIVVWAADPRRERNARLAAGVTALALVTGLAANAWWANESVASDVVERFGTLTGRTDLWQVGLEAWQEEPLFGAGAGFFEDHAERNDETWAGQAHNQVIQSLTEHGIIGLATLALYVAALCRSALRSAVASRATSLGLVGLLLVRCVTETPLTSLRLEHLTVFCLLVAWEREAERRRLAVSTRSQAMVPQQAARSRELALSGGRAPRHVNARRSVTTPGRTRS